MDYQIYLDRSLTFAVSKENEIRFPFGPKSTLSSSIRNFLKKRGHVKVTNELRDLTDVGTLIFYLDKYCKRDPREKWIRSFKVHLKLRNPNKFKEVVDDLRLCLNLLSGDNFEFIIDSKPLVQNQLPSRNSPIDPEITCVALLSGGIDSVAGGLRLLKSNSRPLFLRISTFDNASLEPIIEAFSKFRKRFYFETKKIVAIKTSAEKHSQLPKEDSQRLRSFYFLTSSVFLAASSGINTILINENGIMTVHIPLDPSRASSFSTKTVYPPFIDMFQTLVRKWLDIQDLTVNNLWKESSKTEVVREFAHADTKEILKHTVSCAHAANVQKVLYQNRHQPIFGGIGDKHCGYCFPCLLRRISVHRAGLKDLDVNYCTDPFFAITQSAKNPSIVFLQEASSAGIGVLRFIDKFENTPDPQKPFEFSEIIDCSPYFSGNGTRKIIELHNEFCEDVREFLKKEHPYFYGLLTPNTKHKQITTTFLSQEFMIDMLYGITEDLTPAVKKEVQRLVDLRKWQLRQYLDSINYDLPTAKDFLETLIRRKLKITEDEKYKRINVTNLREVNNSISDDSDDCPPISNVWEDIKKRLFG